MANASEKIHLRRKLRPVLISLALIEIVILSTIIFMNGFSYIEPFIFIIVLVLGIEITIILDSFGIATRAPWHFIGIGRSREQIENDDEELTKEFGEALKSKWNEKVEKTSGTK